MAGFLGWRQGLEAIVQPTLRAAKQYHVSLVIAFQPPPCGFDPGVLELLRVQAAELLRREPLIKDILLPDWLRVDEQYYVSIVHLSPAGAAFYSAKLAERLFGVKSEHPAK